MPSRSVSSSAAAKSPIPLGHMNALKPTTPSSASSGRSPMLPGTRPPQKAKSTRDLLSAAASLSRNAAASTVGGLALSGMSTTQVVPPAEAASLPVAKPSQSVRPGSLKCTCTSTQPGRTCRPCASISSRADPPRRASTATIEPSTMPMSPASISSPTTVPPRTRMSNSTPASSGRLSGELPLVAAQDRHGCSSGLDAVHLDLGAADHEVGVDLGVVVAERLQLPGVEFFRAGERLQCPLAEGDVTRGVL